MPDLLAFDTKQVIETHMNALRSRAILPPVRCITTIGMLFVYRHDDVRFTGNADAPFGECRFAETYTWIPLTAQCIEMWANAEGLNWRKPDGTIVPCNVPAGY